MAICYQRRRRRAQIKSLEHVVDRAGLKSAPRLEKIFDYSMAVKVRNKLRPKRGGREEQLWTGEVLDL